MGHSFLTLVPQDGVGQVPSCPSRSLFVHSIGGEAWAEPSASAGACLPPPMHEERRANRAIEESEASPVPVPSLVPQINHEPRRGGVAVAEESEWKGECTLMALLS